MSDGDQSLKQSCVHFERNLMYSTCILWLTIEVCCACAQPRNMQLSFLSEDVLNASKYNYDHIAYKKRKKGHQTREEKIKNGKDYRPYQ